MGKQPKTKQEVIGEMVEGYYLQIEALGQVPATLEEHLRRLMFSKHSRPDDNPFPNFTDTDLAYGLSLEQAI